MGIIIPINVLYLKHKKRQLNKELNKAWKQHLNEIPIIVPQKIMQYYYVEAVIIIKTGDLQFYKRDVQEFFAGQEIELLEYITFIKTEFDAYHITIHKKAVSEISNNGNIQNNNNILNSKIISNMNDMIMNV